MEVALVSIGDEILIGQVVDTNAVWISRELTALGIHISEMVSISDQPEHITVTLDRLIGQVDFILMTGGLGPTKDDLTKETLNSYFGGKLEINAGVLAKIEDFFKKRGRSLLETNRRQALVPDNCRVLENNFGTAPGMWFSKQNTQIISMPGVPYEMKPMVKEQLIPALADVMEMPVLVNKTVMTYGVPESYLAEMIREWETNLPECMKLAYLPRPGIVRLRLTVSGLCAKDAHEMINTGLIQLKEIIGDHIYGYDDMLLEEVVGKELLSRSLTVTSAESCTGGNIARLLTSIPGSSAYFKGSVVAYSNELKETLLGVKEEILTNYGAVSKAVVEAMAQGICGITGSDASVSISGIAGPDGGTDEKPVGTVWIAVKVKDKLVSREYRFGGHRELVIEQASMAALGFLYRILLGLE